MFANTPKLNIISSTKAPVGNDGGQYRRHPPLSMNSNEPSPLKTLLPVPFSKEILQGFIQERMSPKDYS